LEKKNQATGIIGQLYEGPGGRREHYIDAHGITVGDSSHIGDLRSRGPCGGDSDTDQDK
jgi:hypothetical protein